MPDNIQRSRLVQVTGGIWKNQYSMVNYFAHSDYFMNEQSISSGQTFSENFYGSQNFKYIYASLITINSLSIILFESYDYFLPFLCYSFVL